MLEIVERRANLIGDDASAVVEVSPCGRQGVREIEGHDLRRVSQPSCELGGLGCDRGLCARGQEQRNEVGGLLRLRLLRLDGRRFLDEDMGVGARDPER